MPQPCIAMEIAKETGRDRTTVYRVAKSLGIGPIQDCSAENRARLVEKLNAMERRSRRPSHSLPNEAASDISDDGAAPDLLNQINTHLAEGKRLNDRTWKIAIEAIAAARARLTELEGLLQHLCDRPF